MRHTRRVPKNSMSPHFISDLSHRSQDARLAYRRIYNNYHDIKSVLPGAAAAGVTPIIECVFCSNRILETGEPNALISADRSPLSLAQHFGGSGPWVMAEHQSHGQHLCIILPCGHLMGWSCMDKEASGRCPACGTLWRRNASLTGHCSHPVGTNPFRFGSILTDDESEWLIPPGGHVPEKCRHCATLEALRDLTRLVRNAMPGDGSCAYATDGTVHGFLDTDGLKAFQNLDIAVEPPTIPEALMEELRMRENVIRRNYEGRTPAAEASSVGASTGRVFCFRLAGLAKAPPEQVMR